MFCSLLLGFGLLPNGVFYVFVFSVVIFLVFPVFLSKS